MSVETVTEDKVTMQEPAPQNQKSVTAKHWVAANVVAVAVVYGLTFLPALLSVLGSRVDRLRLPFLGRRKPAGTGAWHSMVPVRVHGSAFGEAAGQSSPSSNSSGR